MFTILDIDLRVRTLLRDPDYVYDYVTNTLGAMSPEVANAVLDSVVNVNKV